MLRIRQPLPNDADQDTARAHLRTLFHDDYLAAKTPTEQLRLLDRLRAMEAEVKPLPREETTPPVTKIYLVISH